MWPETTTMSGNSSAASSGRVVLAATRANVQSAKLNTLCTARRLTIGLTRSRPVRPKTGGRLEKIDDSTVKNGARPEKIEDVLGHLLNVLDGIQANQDAGQANSDQGQHNGAASARGSTSDKLWLKERITAWKNPNLRAFWIFCGEKPEKCELSRVQLQGVFKNTALTSSVVVEQVNPLAGHEVTAFMPRGEEPGHCWHHQHRKAVRHSGEGVASRHRAGRYFGWREGAGGATRDIPGRCRHGDITRRS